jgi:hypothetical protein
MALAIGVIASGCGRNPTTGVLVHVLIGAEPSRPEYLLVSWMRGSESAVTDRRVAASPHGSELASVFAEMDTSSDEPRRLMVKGMRAGAHISSGELRITPVLGTIVELSLSLDAVSSAPGMPPPGAVAAPDAGPTDVRLPLDAEVDRPLDAPAVDRPSAAPEVASIRDMVTPSRGPIAYWSFDEGSGATAADLTHNGNDGRLTNVAPTDWVPGKRGMAVSFNGTSAWMRTDHTPSLDRISRGLTIAAWINRTPVASETGGHIILTQQKGATSGDHYWFGSTAGKLNLGSSDFSGSVTAPAILPAGRWVHVACTYDGAARRLWLDGVQVAMTASSGSFIAEDKGLFVAAGYNGPETTPVVEFFRGAIDELVLYDRALSEAEIKALAQGAAPPGL